MIIATTWLRVLAAFVLLILYPVVSYAKPAPGDRLILMWQVQKNFKTQDIDIFTKKGVNLVQSFSLVKWSDEETGFYLDCMQARKIGVIMAIGSFAILNSRPNLDRDRMAAFIQRWKGHPAVFAWHPFDEAPNQRVPASFQEDVYKFIKGLDPSHSVFISWNGTSASHYECCFSERAFDILDLHAYVRDLPGRRQQNLLKQFVYHRRGSYPIIITLRAFNGPRHPDLSSEGLRRQYNFFFRENDITTNVGFYGWALSPNRGIRDVQDIMHQFKELEILQKLLGKN
jgi:hypothetical protein